MNIQKTIPKSRSCQFSFPCSVGAAPCSNNVALMTKKWKLQKSINFSTLWLRSPRPCYSITCPSNMLAFRLHIIKSPLNCLHLRNHTNYLCGIVGHSGQYWDGISSTPRALFDLRTKRVVSTSQILISLFPDNHLEPHISLCRHISFVI